MDYRQKLLLEIGEPALRALEQLAQGEPPRHVYLTYAEAMLETPYTNIMALARLRGVITTEDVRENERNASSGSSRCYAMRKLQRRGLLECVGNIPIGGGGRRIAYAPWDQVQERNSP